MKKFFLVFGLIMMLTSCFEQGECSDVSTNQLKIGFYNFADRSEKSIVLDSIKIDGTDSVFYKSTTAKSVILPLDPEREAISFWFYFGNSVAILDVRYRVRTFTLAPDCLAIDLYSVTDATGATINQIFFVQKELTKNVNENIRLYF